MVNCRNEIGIMLLVLIPLVLGGNGCKQQDDPAPGPVVMSQQEHEDWEIALVEMRITKNEEFQDSDRTPLSSAAREGFEGLNYFYPAPELKFLTPLLPAAGRDTVILTKRKGQHVPYLRRGLVRFHHLDGEYQLTVFGPVDSTQGNYLWLPFYDETSGKETYGGGRYLDIEVDAQGLVNLDFNYAYNPLCDYNPDGFNCTLPPAENRLPFRVEAGEQVFGAGH